MKYYGSRAQKIQVEDEVFNTIKDAADFLEITPATLSAILLDNEVHEVKGLKVKRISKRINCFFGKIYCYNKGWMFKNAVSLGKLLGIPANYISNKLRNEGKYVDIYGNVYRRVQNPDNFDNNSYKFIDDKPYNKKIFYTQPEVEDVKDVQENDTVQEESVKENTTTDNFEDYVDVTQEVENTMIINKLRDLISDFLKRKDYETVIMLIDILKKVDAEKNCL